jgi:hypothetical protein
MSLPIFPMSPVPAALDRTFSWNENVVMYDSGDSQGDSAYTRPLYQYNMPLTYYNEISQNSLWQLFNGSASGRKGMTKPFLMKDPYDFRVFSVAAVASGVTAGTLYLYDVNSYRVRADTTTIGSLFSSISVYVKLGVNYNYDQDSGVFTIITKGSADVWGVRSMEYFRKCRLMSPYKETSAIWNNFNATLTINEVS